MPAQDRAEGSIRNSLTERVSVFIWIFGLLLFGVTAISALGLMEAGRRADTINGTWLAGTGILSELRDRLSDFRLAETYLAPTEDKESVRAAEEQATKRRHQAEDLIKRYAAVFERQAIEQDTAPLDEAMRAYFAAHDAWLGAAFDHRGDVQRGRDDGLDRLYHAADRAVKQLIIANRLAAQQEADDTALLANRTSIAVLVFSALTIGIACWLARHARKTIAHPLAEITRALTRLAAGDRDVRMPELQRQDEIGALVGAFDAFRVHVLALERAHEETRLAQQYAQDLSRHDPLTGLPNRRVFFAELQDALERCAEDEQACLVMLLDLDGFKSVNDVHGHAIGDLLLCELAYRLQEATRRADTVARLSGDEFAIVTGGPRDSLREAGEAFALRVLDAIRAPIPIAGTMFELDASIGIAACTVEGLDAQNLLRAADIAMCRAKHEGRGQFRWFMEEMDAELRGQWAFEAALRQAVATEAITPHYQPLIEMRTGSVCGFEILARWTDPEYGPVPPDRFIPVAERLGLIPAMTLSLLRQACRDAFAWPPSVHLALNVAPGEFRNPELPRQLFSVLKQEGFDPGRLEIEMTETALVADFATARSVIADFQRSGVRVSLDDFGTGYSSLNHLRELSFNKIKIDRSFVSSLLDNAESAKIVDAILSLARSLGIKVTAEGVESEAIMQHLARRGCDYGQGFHFGRAMPAADASDLMRREMTLAA